MLVALPITAAPGVAVADVYQYSGRIASATGPAVDGETLPWFAAVSAGDQAYKARTPGVRAQNEGMSSADVFVEWPYEME